MGKASAPQVMYKTGPDGKMQAFVKADWGTFGPFDVSGNYLGSALGSAADETSRMDLGQQSNDIEAQIVAKRAAEGPEADVSDLLAQRGNLIKQQATLPSTWAQSYEQNKSTFKDQTGKDASDVNAYNQWFRQKVGEIPLPGVVPENTWIKDPAAAGLVPGYYKQQDKYIGSQKSQAFSNFAKAGLGAALAFGGALAAPALFGGGAAAAGTAAPTAASGGLASSLGSFSTNAALSGAARGAVGGLLGGDGLSGALKGAALGGVTGGYAPAISSSIGGTLGKAVAGGLTGAAGGIASGNATAAGLGGALGAGSAYLQSGVKIPGLGSLPEKLGAGIQGPTRPGSGILGGLANLSSGATSSGLSNITGGSGVNLGDVLKIGGAFYEDSKTRDNNKAIENILKRGQAQAQGYLSPYLQSGAAANTQLSQALSAGFQPGDLTQDPGYQFRLAEGNKALERRMAASGLGQSGAALKAAQEYGQGLADQTYNDAYQRWLANNAQLQTAAGQGLGAAGNSAELSASLSDAQAALLANSQESRNKRLSTILGGLGAFF